jgi:hypothetical protein
LAVSITSGSLTCCTRTPAARGGRDGGLDLDRPLDAGPLGAIADLPEDARLATSRGIERGHEAGGQLEVGFGTPAA